MQTKMLNIVPWTVQQQMRTPHKELVFFCTAAISTISSDGRQASKQLNSTRACLKRWLEKWKIMMNRQSHTLNSHKGCLFFNCSNLIVVVGGGAAVINAIAAHTHTHHTLIVLKWMASQENGHMNGLTLPKLSDRQNKIRIPTKTNKSLSRRNRTNWCEIWSNELQKYDLTCQCNRVNDVWHVFNFVDRNFFLRRLFI